MKRFLIFIALLLASMYLHAGELKFGWNLANEAGGILDMKYMPNQDQFLVLAGLVNTGVLQLRNTETGELIKSNPIVIGSFSKFDFTHDSSKIIINTIDGELSLYNLQDLSLIKSYILPKDTISTSFSNIVVDPVRPYVYVTLYANSGFPEYLIKGQVSVYNYETMEFVKDLTTYDNTSYDCLAISKDGKYLAAMNKGKTYLKVWDLSTFELKSDFCLYDKNLQFDYSCTPTDLKFSELNTDNIYFSGDFPKLNNGYNGLLIYSIFNNNICDSTFFNIYSSKFAFYDNETKLIVSDLGMFFNIYNIKEKITEVKTKQNLDSIIIQRNIITKNDKIIGSSGSRFSMVKYPINTSYKEEVINNNLIYPNPTNDLATIEFDLKTSSIATIELLDTKGSKIKTIINTFLEAGMQKIEINTSDIPSGKYYIIVQNEKNSIVYQLVVEH